MRLTSDELKKVMKDNGVEKIWSWSKVNTFMTSPYEYFLKYIKHEKEDLGSAYAPMGSICHECLEKLYSGEIGQEDMLDIFEDGWLTTIDIADLKFDRNDETKNDSIKTKYKANLEHFFLTHKPIKYKTIVEQFATAMIGGNLLQGYIDLMFKDEKGNYHIIDFKTSTKYTGKTAEEKCGQLVVYAIALHQKGIPFEKIKIGWNFLKYVGVDCQQKNGKIKERIIERNKLGESLQSSAKTWLKHFGYEDKMDDYLMQMIDTNGIDCLPSEVKEMFTLKDAYVYVDLTDKLIESWENAVISNIKDAEMREEDYEKTHNEKIFWDLPEQVEKESFYFATLCGYSASKHKPYAEYLEKLEAKKNGNVDMYGGVGADTEEICCKTESGKAETDDLDLSWLNEI